MTEDGRVLETAILKGTNCSRRVIVLIMFSLVISSPSFTWSLTNLPHAEAHFADIRYGTIALKVSNEINLIVSASAGWSFWR